MFFTSVHAKRLPSQTGVLKFSVSQKYKAFILLPEDIPFWNLDYDATIIFSITDKGNDSQLFDRMITIDSIMKCKQINCLAQCWIEAQLKLVALYTSLSSRPE